MIQDIHVLDVVALTEDVSDRGLLRGQVGTVVESLGPGVFEVEFVDEVRPGRVVLQSKVLLEPPGTVFLLRVFVDVDRRPAEVVTAYRTSKVEKYWRTR